MVFKAGYRRLPKELIDIIWSYDNRNKLLFNRCLTQLLQTSNKMRCMDMIKHDKYLHNIYVTLIRPGMIYNPHRKLPKYGTTYQTYEYILHRRHLYNIVDLNTDNMKCYNLRPINQINIRTFIQSS
jgi:hypothetical protein